MTATPPAIPALMREIIERVPGGASDRSVIAAEHVDQRPASCLPLPPDMDARLVEALARRPVPIWQLYRHQREAWDAVTRGEDLVVVTPTASGKTMCFNLPVVDRCLKFGPAKALYIYPTKALANDQLAALKELLDGVPGAPSVGAFHGDLGSAERAAIKADPPNIIIATPDILHHQQLPKHLDWAALWRDLHFVVIDEAHAYRGVFGSHIAHVMRRIRRTAARYGATPRFIAASATIGNPVEHVEALIGRRPSLVAESGAPEPGKDVVIWDPLILDGSMQGVAHRSSDQEAARLLVASLLAGRSTITFARARRSVNRIAKQAKKALERAGRRDLAGRLVAYVAGLTPERRQEIERGLRDGTIHGVVATTALELGVDIGSLETHPTEIDALPDHLDAAVGTLDDALTPLIAAAQEALDAREAAWRPIATALAEWLGDARKALRDGAVADRLQAAEDWLKDASSDIRRERLVPVASQARELWQQLRRQSSVELEDLVLEGSGNARRLDLRVTVDGTDGAALGVMSQGELNALALSLFLPRAMLPESPFRFILVDDPVQSMDPARVDGLATVLGAVARHHQVIVFSHDDRLPEAVRRLGLAADVIDVVRHEDSTVELRKALDPVSRNLDDARALVKTDELPATVAQQVVLGYCRAAIEAACIEVIRRRRIGRGDAHAAVESLLADRKASELLALALFDDSSQTGLIATRLGSYGEWARDAWAWANKGTHRGARHIALDELVAGTDRLCRRIRETK